MFLQNIKNYWKFINVGDLLTLGEIEILKIVYYIGKYLSVQNDSRKLTDLK